MKTKSINKLLKKGILLISMMLLFASIFYGQKKVELVTGEEITIKSKVLNEDRVVTVNLPANYETTTQKFPVLYLLDGRAHFHHATGAVNYLSQRGVIPQIIIVSIHNVDRNRDFSPAVDKTIPTSGGAENFSNFVSDELVKYINKNYRTSKFTAIMGHSFGGTFVTYSLLKKPEVFDAYIAISPYLHYVDNYLVKMAKEELKSKYANNKLFYLTVGNEPAYFSPLGEFSSLIKEKSSKAIELEYVKMESENHTTVPYMSLYKGLRFIFSDWQLTREKLNEGIAAIDKHYSKLSNKYGFEVKTPENAINLIGYTYLRNKDIDNAIKTFKENVKRYPKSSNVYDSLGEAYENNDELKLAAKNYKKAYDLGIMQQSRNTLVYLENLNRVKKK